jgi:hypothetical protein
MATTAGTSRKGGSGPGKKDSMDRLEDRVSGINSQQEKIYAVKPVTGVDIQCTKKLRGQYPGFCTNSLLRLISSRWMGR